MRQRLIFFKNVYLKIPKKKIFKILDKKDISYSDFYFLNKLHTKTERTIYKLQHLLSVLERALLKNIYTVKGKKKNA